MTVSQLLEALQSMPAHLPVWVDGGIGEGVDQCQAVDHAPFGLFIRTYFENTPLVLIHTGEEHRNSSDVQSPQDAV